MRHRNLVHRDIKPQVCAVHLSITLLIYFINQNLLLNPASKEELAKGHPLGVPILKIADFGFARSLPNAMMAETLCGSPLYMAPEILRYEKYDAKADLWSVGAVLYEMAVGKPPFRAQNHMELLKKIERSKGIKFPDEDPPQVNDEANPVVAVPPDVKALIRVLLKTAPVERSSFEEFFGSTALAKSKFPRPEQKKESPPPKPDSDEEGRNGGHQMIPEHHRIIPPEVLDPKAMIPPSKIKFRPSERYIFAISVVSLLMDWLVPVTRLQANLQPQQSPVGLLPNHARSSADRWLSLCRRRDLSSLAKRKKMAN